MTERECKYIDVHSHIHEYSDREVRDILSLHHDLCIVAVSDDYETSLKTIALSKEHERVYPCVGLHPWEVGSRRDPVSEAHAIVDLALRHDIECLGEVGLDTRFVGETIDEQRRVFDVFLEAAQQHDLALNLHTAGTWEEVYRLVSSRGVRRANFHWYTGPLTLLEPIRKSGYTISVNPAIRIQEKHRRVAAAADLDIILTESDSPYKYRGLEMKPCDVKLVITVIASLKGVEEHEVAQKVLANARRVFGWPA